VRRCPAWPRHADPVDELQHGRLRAVLDPARAVGRRPRPQSRHRPRPPARDVLGSVREARHRNLTRASRSGRRRPGRCRRRQRRGASMKRSLPLACALALIAALASTVPAPAQSKVRVGWCAKTVSSATTPFAIATKMGWYKAEGLDVELVPLPGSAACTQAVVTREVPYSLPSVEPLAIARAQGISGKIFYTAYQGNIYGIAVPADSPVQKIADLKGKTIGVISMGSAGVPVAKALVATAGLNPDSDVNIVVAGEGAQTAAMVRSKQVDALSQFDT